MNIVDCIVAIILIAPLIYGALWYRSRTRVTGEMADRVVQDLCERSRMAAK